MSVSTEYSCDLAQYGRLRKEPKLVLRVKFYCLKGRLSVGSGTGQAYTTQQPWSLLHQEEMSMGRGEDQVVNLRHYRLA